MPDFEIQSALNSSEIIRLRDALTAIKFNVSEYEGKDVFDRFSELLTLLSDPERALVFTLLEDFLHCSYFDQMPLLREALEAIPTTLIEGATQVILLPLSETADDGKPKSPSGLLYPTAYFLFPFISSFAGLEIVPYDKMELLMTLMGKRKSSLIILLDDFIGSGGTAVKTIERYRKLFAKADDRLAIAVVAAQQQGLDLIAPQNVPVFASRIRLKGISESATIQDKANALALMDDLEKRLGVKAKYLRGYRQCEALVKMVRAPNNTFPIFWHPTSASGEAWPRPFRRF